MIITTLLAVPPMTGEQQAALAQVEDDTARLVGPGLEAVLENVMGWTPGDESGAVVPDYGAIFDHPPDARGGLYLIEGRFAGRERRIKLSKPGPWGRELTEWVLLVGDDPEQVAVVYFPDLENAVKTPTTGADVRVVGFFYKVWADTDMNGEPTRFLTFVSPGPGTASVATGAGISPLTPMVVLIVCLAGVYLVIRLKAGRRAPQTARPGILSNLDQEGPGADPAQALEQMAGQEEMQPSTGSNHGDR